MIGIFGSLTGGQKKIVVLLGVIFLALLLGGVASVFPTASNQGYAPTQPIPFSHKLHAGVHQIDCRYCHSSADKSRHAGIPGLNVCMNCHTVVKTDSSHIQKLIQHYNEGKPIEWIRVHELPDHAVFNHKRHVRKGIACQTCHGAVETMDKVVQKAPLNMGWCINCHRGNTTPREVLEAIHPGVDNPHGMQVAPTDCSTCHY